MRMPLTSPTMAAATSAMAMATQMLIVDSVPDADHDHRGQAHRPGTLRSMPPVMITNIWPSAAMASTAPYGAMARRARRSGSPAPR